MKDKIFNTAIVLCFIITAFFFIECFSASQKLRNDISKVQIEQVEHVNTHEVLKTNEREVDGRMQRVEDAIQFNSEILINIENLLKLHVNLEK